MIRLRSIGSSLAIFALFVGCTAANAEDSLRKDGGVEEVPDSSIDLAVPSDGFQLRSVGADIAPGQDIEYCEIGEVPGDANVTYPVQSFELANAPFSHHFVVALAEPGSDADAVLRTLNIGDRVVCDGANYQWPQTGLFLLASAQTPYVSQSFPPGVGTFLHGHQRIVFDYHYLNTSNQTIRAHSAMNVHLADDGSVEHVAIPFSFFNFTIDVPPLGTKAFTAECHFKNDLTIGTLVRHTHHDGQDFSVWYSGGPNDSQHIWTSQQWNEDTAYSFPEPALVKAGDGFKFECDFENPTNSELRFGIKGTDEMCILAGWIWGTGDVRELPPQDCGITWIDSAGIGHPADESGGFPPASALNAKLCLSAADAVGQAKLADAGLKAGCSECGCDACGDILMKCATDRDCSALLTCAAEDCGDAGVCAKNCEGAFHTHSSAIGMLEQVVACLGNRCPGCAPTAGK